MPAAAPKAALHRKPADCRGCSLYERGHGFVPPDGPDNALIAIQSEAPGPDEAAVGRPMIGAAGSMLERIFRRNGWQRGQVRIFNTLSCFPGDTQVEASGIQAAYRRWYDGSRTTLTTAQGQLTGTPNHPVLTTRGWIPLSQIVKGDYLFRCSVRQGMRSSDPDVQANPPLFRELYDTLANAGVGYGVVGGNEDFHGDGSQSQIDVVAVDGLLWNGLATARTEEPLQQPLEASDHRARCLFPSRRRDGLSLLYRAINRLTAHGRVRPLGQTLSKLWGALSQPQSLGSALGSPRYSRLLQHSPDNAVPEVQIALDRLGAHPSKIELAQVLDVTNLRFSGHVYNLSTVSEQYIAGGFIVHNCMPPGMELRGAAYEYSAIAHCAVHRAPVLAGPHKVIVAAGAVALRNRLQLEGLSSIRVEDFHGTVHPDPERPGCFVVPTFHPSHLQRGAHNLIGTVSYDLQLAKEVAQGQWTHQPIDRILDPPVEWLRAARDLLIQQVAADPGSVMIASDMETPDKEGGKAENELTPDDTSYQIKRFNFAWHPDQGVTVPYEGAYIPLIQEILQLPCWHLWWNGYGYDWARCAGNGIDLPWRWQIDGMVAAHMLQSDVPLGLGFWAPFYSRFGAWKHRSQTDPIDYACIDGPQEYRTVSGVIGDLVASGQWQTFHDHCHVLYHDVLKPAQDVGILIDQPELERFHHDLEVKQRRLIHELQACIPEALRPLTGETSKPPEEAVLHPAARTHALRTGELLKSQPDPVKKDLYALVAQRVHRRVPRLIQVCHTCGKAEVSKTHVCKDERGKPAFVNDPANPARFIPAVPHVVHEMWEVSRWFWQEPFNPDSAPQILAYLKHHNHKPGKDKHTRKDSANRDTLLRLSKATKDPFYKFLLDYKAVKKVDSTYAVPTMRRVQADPEGRLHPIPTFRPSTQRLSYVAPNITNVVQDKGGKESLAAGFRRAVVAGPSCRLLEVDFASAEPTEVGWLIRDPRYLRLATLGAHAYVTSHLLHRPPDLGWSDADLGAYLKQIKTDPRHEALYDKCKRANNGINYGLTAYGMAETFPDVYKDQADAQKIVDLIFDLAPNLPVWQAAVQQRAYDVGYLGGVGPPMTGATAAVYAKDRYGKALDPTPFHHPFGYQHWFWSVLAYKPITEKQRLWREKRGRLCVEINGRWFAVDRGEDAKRCVAYYPQSIAAGVLKRAMLQLFAYPDHPSYIGDAYFGRTPLRAPIHDSLLLEVPHGQWDRVVEAVAREMQRPIVEQPLPKAWGMGEYLSIGADAKVGQNWKDTEKLQLPGWTEVATESTYYGVEEIDEDDAQELGVVA